MVPLYTYKKNEATYLTVKPIKSIKSMACFPYNDVPLIIIPNFHNLRVCYV